MSRIDTTQRNLMPRLGEMPTRSLNAPGLTPMPVVESDSVRLAESFNRAMAGVAAGVQGVAGFLERRDDRREAVAREEEALIRGKATLDARSQLPQILQDINDGKTIIPDDADPASWAMQQAEQRAAGYDPNGRDAYIKAATPAIAEAAVRRRAQLRQQAVSESLTLLGENAIQATTPDAIRQQIQAATDLGISESDAMTIALAAAKSAAESGDAVRLQAATEVLGDRFPAEQRKIQQVFASGLRQAQEQARIDAKREVERMNLAGTPAEIMEERLKRSLPDLVQRTGATEDQLRWQLVGDMLTAAAIDGDYDKFDALAASAGTSEQARLTQLRQQALGRHRANQVDALVGEVTRGRVPVADAVDSLNARYDAYVADPASPDGISPDMYRQALTQITAGGAQASKLDMDIQAVTDAMTKAGAGMATTPLPPGMDKAIESLAIRTGAAEGMVNGSDVSLTRWTNPQAAAFMMNVNGSVTNGLAEQIARSFGTGDTAQIEYGGNLLLALYRQNPPLAHQVINRMADYSGAVAQDRAQAFLDRAKDEVGPFNSSNYAAGIRGIAGAVANTTPDKIDAKKIDQFIADKAGKVIDVESAIRDSLKEGFEDNNNAMGWRWIASTISSNVDPNREIGPIGVDMRSFYERTLRTAFRQRLVAKDDDETAWANAQKLAVDRTLSEYPPIRWNGEVYFVRGARLNNPEFGDQIMQLVDAKIAAGELTHSRSYYAQNYRPVWNEQEQAWTLNRVGRMDEALDGIVIRYEDNMDAATQKAIDQAKKNARSTETPWWAAPAPEGWAP